MTNAMTTPPQDGMVIEDPKTVKGMLARVDVKRRFEEILGRKAPAFISSIISAVQANAQLQQCDPRSIISAAAVAAALDLPITPGLGQAHIVPYGGAAQFQIGWKGYVQLGQRSGQYQTMNAVAIRDGELVSLDKFNGAMCFDAAAKKSDRVTGYLFYFRLLNGFEKWTYMTVEQCQDHGKKYSKSYNNPKGKWQLDFPSMALKTVVKMGLSKWGPLSTEMQKAMIFDSAAVTEDGQPEYIDRTPEAATERAIVEPRRASAAAAEAAPTMVHEKPTEANMAGAAEVTPATDLAVFIPTKVTKSNDGLRIYINDTEYYATSHEGYAAIAKAAATKNQAIEVSYTVDGEAKIAKNVTMVDA